MLWSCISLDKPVAFTLFLESSVQNTAITFNLTMVGN